MSLTTPIKVNKYSLHEVIVFLIWPFLSRRITGSFYRMANHQSPDLVKASFYFAKVPFCQSEEDETN